LARADSSNIQDGKDIAKNELFGNADDKVKYAKGVKDHLTARSM
jgi:hypothetical protein